jgi:hypothetical protein
MVLWSVVSSGINRAILAQRNFEGYRRRRLRWRTGWRGALRNFAITAAQAAAVAVLVQEVAPRVDAGAVVQEAVDMVLDRYEDAKDRVLGTRRPPAESRPPGMEKESTERARWSQAPPRAARR